MKNSKLLFLSFALILTTIQGCDWFKKKEEPQAVVKTAPAVEEQKQEVQEEKIIPKPTIVDHIQNSMRQGVDPNPTVHGQSYLSRAIITRNIRAVRLLLSSGADVNAIEEQFGFPPIFLAVKPYFVAPNLQPPAEDANEEEKKIYKDLMDYKESFKVSTEIFYLLLNQGADVNSSSRTSETLLHLVIRNARKDLVLKLISLQADIHAYAERIHRTPLMQAAYYGNWELTQVLIHAGANVLDQSDAGQTALSLAQKKSFPKASKETHPFIDYDKTIAILKANGAK